MHVECVGKNRTLYVAYAVFHCISYQQEEKILVKCAFFYYHDDCFFGLARADTKVSNIKKSDWIYPTVAKKRQNTYKWKNAEV